MKSNLSEIDKKVIKFLLTAGVYSDLALVKNLGISYEELEKSYANLLENGYLESYDEYKKREMEECSSHSGCGGCSKSHGSCGSCCSKQEDYSDIKVITWKAIEEFQE